MYTRRLLPPGVPAPAGCEGEGFRLRPLRLSDAEADFAAVVESAARLRGWMNPADPWPEGLTLHENRVDLGWHEREFTLGHSFAWTVTAPEDAPVLGCAYLYPSDREGFAAMAFWWVRTGAPAALDAAVGAAFRAMLAPLPLAPIAFPGRDIGWADWAARAPAPGA